MLTYISCASYDIYNALFVLCFIVIIPRILVDSWDLEPIYLQTSNIIHTLVGNEAVDHTNIVGALPVGAAPTTYSFSSLHLASMDWAKTTARRDEKHFKFFLIKCADYERFDGTSSLLY